MANRGPSFGLSRECHLKTLAKFDLDRATQALRWVEEVIGRPLDPSSEDQKDQFSVRNSLRDGTALCELMNIIKPGAVKKINTSKIAFKQMENIEMFLKACKEFGMMEVDTFQTQDLYDCKAIYSVINTLYTLGSLAQKNGFTGPTIGVKMADKNVRDFSEDTIAEGKTVIGLQYGTNKGANQAGMTAYGATRKM